MESKRPTLTQKLIERLKGGQLGSLNEADLKKFSWLALLGLLGLYLLIAGGPQNRSRDSRIHPTGGVAATDKASEETPVISGNLTRSTGDLEAKLSSMLSRIAGAGKVDVCILLEDDGEKVFADNTVEERRMTEDRDEKGIARTNTETRVSRELVLSRGQSSNPDQPVVRKSITPRIRGVLVVAEGATISRVKFALTQATSTALGIPEHKVIVFPRGK